MVWPVHSGRVFYLKMDQDIDIQFDFVSWDDKPKEIDEAEKPKVTKRRNSECLERSQQNEYRRAFSETQLLDITPKEFKEGYSYHFITGGDVDGLSYLKVILRQQPLEYCLISTWVMAAEDIYLCQEYLGKGLIKRLDFYLGEVYRGNYPQEYALIKQVAAQCGGCLKTFKNHAKILAGYGERFAFGVEGSANFNTNPRTENACINIGEDIYKFYKEYFDGINGFNKE